MIDEPDDLHAELLAFVQLARERQAAGLVPTSSSRSRGPTCRATQANVNRQAITAGDGQRRGRRQHAARDDQRGEERVDRRPESGSVAPSACSVRISSSVRLPPACGLS